MESLKSREERCKHKITPKHVIEEETEELGEKPHRNSPSRNRSTRIKLEYMNNKRPSKPFNEECCMWESSMPYICSTLSIRWSRRSSARACAWEEGCVVSSGTEVKCSISSLMSPPSSATLSLGIWETPTNGPGIWALFRVMVYALIRSSLCIT